MARIAFRTSFAAAMILAGVGALLVQAGLLTTAQAWHGLRAWPVLLIAWGLEAIWHARGRPLPVFVGPALVVAGVLVAWFASDAGGAASEGTGSRASGVVEPAEGPLDLTLDVGAADLSIEAGTGPEVVVDWSGAEPQFDRSPGHLVIRGRLDRDFPDGCDHATGTRWSVRLPDGRRVALAIRTGASQVRADLARVQLSALSVAAGVSAVRIDLPAPASEVPVSIDAGASSVDLTVPASTAVRLESRTAVGNVDLSGLTLEPVGDAQATAGWDAARARYDIKLQGGVSSLALRAR